MISKTPTIVDGLLAPSVSGLVLLTLVLGGCAHSLRPFPASGPMLVDHDQRPFGPRPEEYYSPFAWDGADQLVFRPIARFFAVDPAGEAVNVNAIDEVPNSSWFTNRLGTRPISTEEMVQAACDGPALDPSGPWTVVAAKPNGANPGFIIEDGHENRYLLKFDSIDQQPERATSADVIGSILYWAVGYNAPCNRIVFFDREILQIGEDVTVDGDDGQEVPLTLSGLDPVFENAFHASSGLTRAAASRFLPGRPIGPWRYEGTLSEDPNDVIPHEDRRELRGGHVIAAWLNHFDSREQNTLAIWHATDDTNGYVDHYYLDFGDTLGSVWSYEGISRRLGHSAYLDFGHLTEDFLSFGLIPRPWRSARFGPTDHLLAYFSAHDFDPETWRPGYPNPAFMRASERDKAWMARKIAEIRPEHLRAVIAQAHFEDDATNRELFRVLMERRELILRRYFHEVSPLTSPTVNDGQLCLRDLAVQTGLVAAERRPYYNRIWPVLDGERGTGRRGQMTRRAPAWVCVALPEPSAAPYLIVDIEGHWASSDEEAMPARTHLRWRDGAYQVVGLERPTEAGAP